MASERGQGGVITEEMVENACVAYIEAAFDLHHEIKPTEVEKRGMRAALLATKPAKAASAFWEGVAGAMLITVFITAALLWVEGCAVAVWAVLRTHQWLAILAVDLMLFLGNALLLLFIATMWQARNDE